MVPPAAAEDDARVSNGSASRSTHPQHTARTAQLESSRSRSRDPRRDAFIVEGTDLGFELGKKPEQIATQPMAIAIRDPGCAHPIERLGDGICWRNHL